MASRSPLEKNSTLSLPVPQRQAFLFKKSLKFWPLVSRVTLAREALALLGVSQYPDCLSSPTWHLGQWRGRGRGGAGLRTPPTRRPLAAGAQDAAQTLEQQVQFATLSPVIVRVMKMHFCIPLSQQRPDGLGGRYVVSLGPGTDRIGSGWVTLRTPSPLPPPRIIIVALDNPRRVSVLSAVLRVPGRVPLLQGTL